MVATLTSSFSLGNNDRTWFPAVSLCGHQRGSAANTLPKKCTEKRTCSSLGPSLPRSYRRSEMCCSTCDGLFFLHAENGVIYQTFCDMTSGGGGWTLVASVHENNMLGKCTVGDRWSKPWLLGHPGPGPGHLACAQKSLLHDWRNRPLLRSRTRNGFFQKIPSETWRSVGLTTAQRYLWSPILVMPRKQHRITHPLGQKEFTAGFVQFRVFNNESSQHLVSWSESHQVSHGVLESLWGSRDTYGIGGGGFSPESNPLQFWEDFCGFIGIDTELMLLSAKAGR
ncbi:hypothetical protein HPG69_011998 [Diceros bicornis minor]|uniref:Fibrinogen C-terminal domain-containing protein n=1 Tax=Diceros bicornis minor TaxID=77932 RepID=A0A7J7EFH1_DICBM|nr:hypothetical protein HPG69_011998 [Diceros bicornis minor]